MSESDVPNHASQASVPSHAPEAGVSEAPIVAGTSSVQSVQPPSFTGLRTDIPRWQSVCAALFCLAICLFTWWLVTRGEHEERILGYSQLPSPKEALEYFPNLWDSHAPQSHLLNNTFKSLTRVAIGFSLALLVGVPLGVAAGCFSLVRAFLSPLILFGRNIPVAALTALVFALFKSGETEKVMFIFIACVAFIVSDATDAIRDVAQRYVETALTLGASRLQIILKVLVPLALPTIFNSARVLFGLAFGYIMLVEVVNDSAGAGGLGNLLNVGRKRGITEVMAIIILTIPLVAWLIDQCLSLLQCLIFRWKYGRDAERNALWQLIQGTMRLFWR
ncbi:MAG: ABC transporter permease subunit [Planctomycetaceae bacterium]|nr:ABC transporter permease subunit [Planctomycetaceae bacterium]